MPACGFSFGLERLDLARGPTAGGAPVGLKRILVIGVDLADQAEALRAAAELRRLDGVSVEQEVRLRGLKSALRYADRAAFDLVVIVGQRERSQERVVLRNMRTREETSIARSELVETARRVLA